MGDTVVINTPADIAGTGFGMDNPCQVILFNDDHNIAGYVVQCLCRVFGHPEQMAVKIMMEAHTRGRSIAQVEDQSKAEAHRAQLQSCGLTATVEHI